MKKMYQNLLDFFGFKGDIYNFVWAVVHTAIVLGFIIGGIVWTLCFYLLPR